MLNGSEKRRHPRRKPFVTQSPLSVRAVVDGGTVLFSAKLLDISRGGLRIALPQPLEEGLAVDIAGEIVDLRGQEKFEQKCHVRSCTADKNGNFILRLSFGARKLPPITTTADLYEVLQLSRSADFDTIQRVFRMLAQRYHPDNQQTGNTEVFQQVIQAHRVLSDPESRAAYDLQTQGQAASKLKLFDSWKDAQGTQGERRIRRGVLTILYRHRQTNPRQPEVSLNDLSEAIGVPKEHLEFSLWFLKENKWIRNSDSGRLEITHAGVLAVEAEDEAVDISNKDLPAIEAAR